MARGQMQHAPKSSTPPVALTCTACSRLFFVTRYILLKNYKTRFLSLSGVLYKAFGIPDITHNSFTLKRRPPRAASPITVRHILEHENSSPPLYLIFFSFLTYWDSCSRSCWLFFFETVHYFVLQILFASNVPIFELSCTLYRSKKKKNAQREGNILTCVIRAIWRFFLARAT
jgi:hypothetical protein